MFGKSSQRTFMSLARSCYSIVVDLTILNNPDQSGNNPLAETLSDSELELMQVDCPYLFSLAKFYFDGMPELVTATMYNYAISQASEDPKRFMENHLASIQGLKHKIYAWLAIPEAKRIRSLSKGLTQKPGSLPPREAAQELDLRVRRLEISWVDKSKLFHR